MDLTATAIFSLACLLSDGKTDAQAAQEFMKKLTPEQASQLVEIAESGACLPKKFEEKIRPGDATQNHSPTTDL